MLGSRLVFSGQRTSFSAKDKMIFDKEGGRGSQDLSSKHAKATTETEHLYVHVHVNVQVRNVTV